MANGKVNFVMELENGQYIRASNEIIKSTERIEKQSLNSYRNMDTAGKAFNQKFRKYFSFNALFGAAFGLGFTAINKLFGAFNKGISNAINKNEDLKRSFDDLKNKSDEVWTAIGEKSAPVLNEIGKFIYDVLDSKNKDSLINIKPGMSEKELIKALKIINGIIADAKSKNINVDDPKNYWNVYLRQREEVENKLKRFEEERLQRLKKINEEYNKAVESLSNKVFDLFGGDENTKKFIGSLKQAGDEINTITKSMEEAAKQGKQLALSGDSILGIFLAVYAIISSITKGIISLSDNTEQTEAAIAAIQETAQKYNDTLEKINRNLKVLNAELSKQELIENNNLQAIDDEIESIKKIVSEREKESKAIQDNADAAKSKDKESLDSFKKFTQERIKEYEKEVDFFKNNPLGIIANIGGFGNPLASAEQKLKNAQNSLKLIDEELKSINDAIVAESELAGIDTEIFGYNQKINELIKTRTTLLQNQALETQGLEERLLDAKLEGAKTDEESAKFIEQIINNIYEQIDAYQQILDVTTDKNEQLSTEADIQEHLNQIAELRAKQEELTAKSLQKQVDLMKKYVDLGLDLENIRVVKQLTKGFAAQGYSGTQLGGALQELGVSNRAISGKTLNIYGDINNTLNQASPSTLIANMNDLINKIGGA